MKKITIPILAVLLLATGCNKAILKRIEINSNRSINQISILDSIYRFKINAITNYEKQKIDSAYNSISDIELLKRIRTITSPPRF